MKSNHRQAKHPGAMAVLLTVLAAIVMFAGVLVPAQAQTYNINFPAPTTFTATYCSSYPCDNSVTAATTGDFNGDGKLDVLTLDGSNLNVILGKGDGTFQAPISNYLGNCNSNCFYYAIAVGDFKGDGVLDVATWGTNINPGNAQIQIFLGNGTGTLALSETYQAPNGGNANPGQSVYLTITIPCASASWSPTFARSSPPIPAFTWR